MLTTVSPAHRLKELRQKFAHLAKMVHPDTVPKEYADKAGEVFNKLITTKEAAEAAILEGTYDDQFIDTFVLKSRKEAYECQEGPYKKGDFSFLYKTKNSRSEAVLVKIATKPPHNPWLEKERAFARANKDKYIPEVIDSFFVMDDRSRFQALVIPYLDGYVSLADILHAYPKGLDPRDAAWICRRVMGQAVLARGLGVVHTAIVPDHVLVHIRSHDPLHIGWGHAIKIKDRTHLLIEKWKNLYPPEMLDRKKVNQKADVFMAAQTILLLFGGNKLPKGMERVLSRCTETSPSKRPKAHEALKDLTKAIRSEWGKKYRNLKMP
jgi:hypothetical protein